VTVIGGLAPIKFGPVVARNRRDEAPDAGSRITYGGEVTLGAAGEGPPGPAPSVECGAVNGRVAMCGTVHEGPVSEKICMLHAANISIH